MALGVKRSYAEIDDQLGLGSVVLPRAVSAEVEIASGLSGNAHTKLKAHGIEKASTASLVLSGNSSDGGAATRRQYSSEASIVLVGLRGSGKSSLAILACTAYGRRLVDFDRIFFERTGKTVAAHRQQVDLTEHHRRHRQILEDVLDENSTGSVIVCNFADLERGTRVLRQFAKTHPVIHVVRDLAGIQAHVKVWTIEKTAQMLALSGRLLRSCSNFEFFNCTEDVDYADPDGVVTAERANEDLDVRPATTAPAAPFLRLKRAERDFLNLLRMMIGNQSTATSHQSAYPLSQIPIEARQYTYAVAIRASEVRKGAIDLQAIQIGADAVQIVYDLAPSENSHDVPYMLGDVFAQIRRATILPIVVEVEFDYHGFNAESKNNYLQYLLFCLRFAPEYLLASLDLDDFSLNSILASRGNTKIIAQSSRIDRLPDRWDDDQCRSQCSRARSAGCDMIQLTALPSTTLDHAGPLTFRYKTQSNTFRVSTFNTGRLGRPTQCFNSLLTPVTAGTLQEPAEGGTLASITAQEATQALFASFMFESQDFCILGANVEHSLSPRMHNAGFATLGMRHSYVARSSKSLDIVARLASNHNFGGASVTQPYKVEILTHLNSLSRHATIIRAVNTILPIRKGHHDAAPSDFDVVTSRNQAGPILTLHGDNTDWIGIRACVRRGLSPINTVRASTCGLVIGAGGMARASIYAMLHMGVRNIFIHTRTTSSAEELAHYYNNLDTGSIIPRQQHADGYKVRVIRSYNDPWPEGFRPPTMIVSSVPAHLNADGTLHAPFTLPPRWLESPTGGVLLEHTYKPLVTELVRQVRAESHRGWIVMTGLDMLPEQAFAQFELFTGRRAPRRVMREEVLRAIRNDRMEGGAD